MFSKISSAFEQESISSLVPYFAQVSFTERKVMFREVPSVSIRSSVYIKVPYLGSRFTINAIIATLTFRACKE